LIVFIKLFDLTENISLLNYFFWFFLVGNGYGIGDWYFFEEFFVFNDIFELFINNSLIIIHY